MKTKENDTAYEKALLSAINDGDTSSESVYKKIAERFGKDKATVKRDLGKMERRMYVEGDGGNSPHNSKPMLTRNERAEMKNGQEKYNGYFIISQSDGSFIVETPKGAHIFTCDSKQDAKDTIDDYIKNK